MLCNTEACLEWVSSLKDLAACTCLRMLARAGLEMQLQSCNTKETLNCWSTLHKMLSHLLHKRLST